MKSIVYGRADGGRLRKDIMSPPPGWLKHDGSGNDYGLGVMGVDEVNKLILFEVRGSENRPYTIALNQPLIAQIRKEFIDAQACNPYLKTQGEDYVYSDIEVKYWETIWLLRVEINGFGIELDKWKRINANTASDRFGLANFMNASLTEMQRLTPFLSLNTNCGARPSVDKIREKLHEINSLGWQLHYQGTIKEYFDFFNCSFKAPLQELEKRLWELESEPFSGPDSNHPVVNDGRPRLIPAGACCACL